MSKKALIIRMSFFAAILSLLLTIQGCHLPSLTAYTPGDPSDAIAEFIAAVNRDDEKTANELLYDSHWYDQPDTEQSDADQQLARALAESRSFSLYHQKFTDQNNRRATLSIRFTVLDLGLFEKELTKTVEEDVKQQMYEGNQISESSDMDALIDQHKLKLLENPEPFYTTSDFDVEMILSKGKWRIHMTDGFYNAILGICEG